MHHRIKQKKSYTNFQLIFLPKKTIAKLQPLDAGIIRSFKTKYRKEMILKYIDQAKNGEKININVRDACIFN